LAIPYPLKSFSRPAALELKDLFKWPLFASIVDSHEGRPGSNSGKIVASGAIDRPEVRKAVIEHMEGGEGTHAAAFEKIQPSLSFIVDKEI